MLIELKTGDNFNMIPLAGLDSSPCSLQPRDAHNYLTEITTIDATKQTQFSYTCPSVCPSVKLSRYCCRIDVVFAQVSPNSAIYFYEFSSNSSTQKYWTTRFTITDLDGNSTPPSQTTQSNGDKIPWGNGTITDGSSLPVSSSSGLSSLSSSPSSSLSRTSTGISSSQSHSSHSSSSGSPSPTQSGSTQSDSSSGIIAVPSAVLLAVALAAAFF